MKDAVARAGDAVIAFGDEGLVSGPAIGDGSPFPCCQLSKGYYKHTVNRQKKYCKIKGRIIRIYVICYLLIIRDTLETILLIIF